MNVLKTSKFLKDDQFPFHISTYVFEDDESIPVHSHEFTELVYVAEGSGEHFYNHQTHRISHGDVFVIEPGAEHGYRVGSNNHLVVYNVLFLPHTLKEDFAALFKMSSFVDFFYVEPFIRNETRFHTHLRLGSADQIDMLNLLGKILMEYSEQEHGYRILIKTRLIELFVLLSRAYERNRQPGIQLLDADGKMLYVMKEFIRQHAAQPLALDQVSAMCNLSPTAFAAKFKKLTGHTFIEFRNLARIDNAMRLLQHSGLKIAHIAQEVGFEDLSFFNKLFKKQTGLTPKQFRSQFEQNNKHSEEHNEVDSRGGRGNLDA